MAAALKAAGGTVKYTEYPEEKHFIALRTTSRRLATQQR